MDDNFPNKSRKKRSRRRKATKSGRERQYQLSVNEFSVNDFANASNEGCALKKISRKMTSSTGSFVLLRHTEMLKKVEEIPDAVTISDDESPWYDRTDIGETDDEVDADDEAKNDIESLSTSAFGIKAEKLQNSSLVSDVVSRPGNIYPLDIWCILANYIKPEQTQSFACICRGSHLATSSVSFWSRLYKRFIQDTTTLPARLKPDWIESRDGYKDRVVRALFIAYKNLHNRLEQQMLETTRDTHVISQLVGLRCCHAWYELRTSSKQTNLYLFYFKFKRVETNGNEKKNYLCKDDERLHYLTANNERDFVVFQITVSNFIRLESVSGETLTDISVNLSRNLRFHCIKMTFHVFRHDGRYRKGDGKMVVLDPASEFRLLRWWYPLYPHYDV